MAIAALVSMDAQPSQAPAQIVIVGREHAAVAGTAQILRRKEAEAADLAQHARATSLILGTDRLGGVFDDRDAVPHGDPPQRIHFGTLSEEMDGQDGTRLRSDRTFELFRVEIHADRIDVYKDGPRADAMNGTGRREECEGGGDHFVACTDVERHQCQDQGIRPGRAANGIACVAISGRVRLKFGDFVAENEGLRSQDPVDRFVDLRRYCLMLGDKIDERDRRGNGGMRRLRPGDSHGAAPGNTEK